MFAPQREWWNLPNFIKLLVGGYGSGKTFAHCKRAIALALHNAPAPHTCVSPTFPIARKTLIPTMLELLEGKNRATGGLFRYKYNKQASEFTIWYKGRVATIWVVSGENPERLKGPNLGSASLDEPFLMQEEVFWQMTYRLRHPEAKKLELSLTGTPEQLNWGYDLVHGDLGKEHDVGIVRAPTYSNKVVGDGYVKRLRASLSTKAQAAYIEGEMVNLAEGLVYYAFNPNCVQHIERIPDEAVVEVGMDFNVQPFAFIVYWRMGKRIHILREYLLDNADTQYACQVLREDWGNRIHNFYPDATGGGRHTSSPDGRSDFWYIEAAGYQINAYPPGEPLRKDRYNAANALFGLDTTKGEGVTMEPDCVKLRKALTIYSHKEMNKQKDLSHILDATTYPMSYLFPVSYDVLNVRKWKETAG